MKLEKNPFFQPSTNGLDKNNFTNFPLSHGSQKQKKKKKKKKKKLIQLTI